MGGKKSVCTANDVVVLCLSLARCIFRRNALHALWTVTEAPTPASWSVGGMRVGCARLRGLGIWGNEVRVMRLSKTPFDRDHSVQARSRW